ncbi:hypothetical protein QQ056_19435 [Oscillatoria laete-virens NRMC-F 0139]|nr:hypothetical protein [Oscillatoria laete-virens]MDL5055705.1 hypothetical protein [Oscillatoria laete-virens NRMC-F 0139]
MGTHAAKLRNEIAPIDYRHLVEKRLYQLADKLLRIGGIIHFGNRDAYPGKIAHEKNWEDHKERAANTHIEVSEPKYLKCGPLNVEGGVPLKTAIPKKWMGGEISECITSITGMLKTRT